jgi:RNA polymerase sigma-70 factor (ECF subfamily)
MDDPLRDLLVRSSKGDEAALAELYDATSPQVFGLALRILRERAAAEEATLEVYLQVWRQAARHDPARGSVVAWLLVLARSRSIDLLRAQARHAERRQTLEEIPDLPAPGPDPETATQDSERARRVRDALARLPAEQRRAIEAAFFEGLTHTEVARALAQPLGTVKTRIRTGLATLRGLLAGAREGRS